ncbi:MAG: class I SAM-dependent methyltransferase [Clostridium perfringens]|nr:class I SAM-dependent methyltransferase [Clostridium perfringens]
MNNHKFDEKKLDILNNPERLNLMDLDEIFRVLNMNEKSILVDLGAGTAFFSKVFLDRITDSKCYALDISKHMINYITENVILTLNDRLEAKLMEESIIPLKTELADLLFMILLFHELDNPLDTLKESYRVLKTGGKIFIADWKEGENSHAVSKDFISTNLKAAGFSNIKEINASEKLVCFIAEK